MSFAPAAGVHTFKYKQSSLTGGEPSITAMLSRGRSAFRWSGWMQTLPNLLASRTPSHFATGCGGCQRSAPTGGAANGMPLKPARHSTTCAAAELARVSLRGLF